ncbi:hypothetical protein [Candidatus Nitrosocosmicus hydrocola]|jgi:hypothetical protein|uniref:hypothetical protein n=1 Tax=Candidatus Nitrosocosmicus hydrocola TaxID=1826872 RepID=UPI0011E5C00E|nr:hypothetical protein [Candidatus Nitrosocosmicus hydrocola]
MTKNSNTVDLSVNFDCDDKTITFIRKYLCINKIGLINTRVNISNKDHVILKIKNTEIPEMRENSGYMYLIYENFDDKAIQKGSGYDILVLNGSMYNKSLFQKLAGKNIGFEILISNLKYRNSYEVGKWFSDVKYIHYLCKKYRHQLILSSGACNVYELISTKIFDSFLSKLDISSDDYWFSLHKWLENKNRGIVYDFN